MKHEVPLTLEGASILHQMFRIRWQAWKALADERRREVLEEVEDAVERQNHVLRPVSVDVADARPVRVSKRNAAL